MALRFPCRPASDLVQPKLTVGSCRLAADVLTGCGHLLNLYLARLADGPERREARRLVRLLWRLAHWFGRLVEDEE